MPELKAISKEAVAAALEKAERYRLLNEPRESESICRDALRTSPGHQHALITLLLSLTDQFGKGFGVDLRDAREQRVRAEGLVEHAAVALASSVMTSSAAAGGTLSARNSV